LSRAGGARFSFSGAVRAATPRKKRAMSKMSVQDIEKVLIREVSLIMSLEASAIAPDAPLHTLKIDSLAFVELLVAIEKEFKLRLIDSGLTMEDLRTIHSLALRIGESLGGAAC
jgi:acyl carrier protein